MCDLSMLSVTKPCTLALTSLVTVAYLLETTVLRGLLLNLEEIRILLLILFLLFLFLLRQKFCVHSFSKTTGGIDLKFSGYIHDLMPHV